MRFLKRHKELLWFGLFAVVSAAYFSLQFLGLRHHLIHTPVDDVIPFVPAFIIPYVLWYFYVPGMMLFMCFKDREVFMRQVATLFTGAFICITVFALYPTRIDFRPDASGGGLLLALCRLIYANDQPYNVLPSLHCYEATAIHLASFGGGAQIYGTEGGVRGHRGAYLPVNPVREAAFGARSAIRLPAGGACVRRRCVFKK